MTSTAADIEQFRPGFEAWARDKNIQLTKDLDGDYFYPQAKAAWGAWIASKREASIEPIDLRQTQAENVGGAQKDEAKDAARYRWLRDRPETPDEAVIDVAFWQNCAGESLRGEVLDRNIDAAIEAQANAQEKK